MILSLGNSKITIAVHFETLLHSDVEKWRMGSIQNNGGQEAGKKKEEWFSLPGKLHHPTCTPGSG